MMDTEAYEAWLEAKAEYDEDQHVSECDCCGKMKAGCRDVVYLGMDTHACPQCRGDGPEDY